MFRLLAAPCIVAASSIAFAGGADDTVVQRVHVRMADQPLSGATCHDIFAASLEPGVTTFRFQFELADARRAAPGRYTAQVRFTLGDVVITMPSSITWPHMTAVDRERVDALRRAIYHHEVGHVRVAEAVRDELNAHESIAAPDPLSLQSEGDAIGRDGFETFKRAERAYDALVDHGRKQHLAPGELGGADTVIRCP